MLSPNGQKRKAPAYGFSPMNSLSHSASPLPKSRPSPHKSSASPAGRPGSGTLAAKSLAFGTSAPSPLHHIASHSIAHHLPPSTNSPRLVGMSAPLVPGRSPLLGPSPMLRGTSSPKLMALPAAASMPSLQLSAQSPAPKSSSSSSTPAKLKATTAASTLSPYRHKQSPSKFDALVDLVNASDRTDAPVPSPKRPRIGRQLEHEVSDFSEHASDSIPMLRSYSPKNDAANASDQTAE